MHARALWKGALLATLVHFALLGLYPLLRPAYAPCFRGLAQLSLAVIDPLPGPIDVRFEPGSGGPLAKDVVAMDTVVTLGHRELAGAAGTFGASSFFHAYFPSSVLLALFLAATPLAWRARRGPLLWALLGLHLFFAARCVIAVFYCHAQATLDGRPLLALSPGARRALHLAWHFGWNEMLTNYLVPLVLWSLCAFGARSNAGARAGRTA